MIGDPDPWYEDCILPMITSAFLTAKISATCSTRKTFPGAGFKEGSLLLTLHPRHSSAVQHDYKPSRRHPGGSLRGLSQSISVLRDDQQPAPYRAGKPGRDRTTGRPITSTDLTYFWQAVEAGNFPAVTFLKAARAQDGHPANSSPLDEQFWLVNTLNQLQKLPDWNETAVFIAWDDSDGWYDHVMGPIINQSATSDDALTGTGLCGSGANSLAGIQGRCGSAPDSHSSWSRSMRRRISSPAQ